jgi:hypothetical protein
MAAGTKNQRRAKKAITLLAVFVSCLVSAFSEAGLFEL